MAAIYILVLQLPPPHPFINPHNISRRTLLGEKHFRWGVILIPRLLAQQNTVVVLPPRRNIPSRPKILILSHERLLRDGRLPKHVSTIPNHPIFVRLRKDTPMSTIPRSAEGAPSLHLRRYSGIRRPDGGSMHIRPEFIGIRRVRPFPRRDSAPTPTENQLASFKPRRAESVKKIGLPRHDARLEIRIPQLAHIHRVLVAVEPGVIEPAVCAGEAQCMGRPGRLFGIDVPEVEIGATIRTLV